jgi:ribosomal 50S subunit-associated protein YjgA (DUF615 family)
MPETTPQFLRDLLREFDEECREHGEPDAVSRRFYLYLQLAMRTVGDREKKC